MGSDCYRSCNGGYCCDDRAHQQKSQKNAPKLAKAAPLMLWWAPYRFRSDCPAIQVAGHDGRWSWFLEYTNRSQRSIDGQGQRFGMCSW